VALQVFLVLLVEVLVVEVLVVIGKKIINLIKKMLENISAYTIGWVIMLFIIVTIVFIFKKDSYFENKNKIYIKKSVENINKYIKNKCVNSSSENLFSLYQYPKYKEATLVIIIDENIETAFDFVQNTKENLKKIPFICLSRKEVLESADVFALQFFDIKQIATLISGSDIFKEIIIERSELKRKVEFEVRNKNIYLRQEVLRCSEDFLLKNIRPELQPIIRACNYLNISLNTNTLDHISKKSFKDLHNMLDSWTEKIENAKV
jgi:hypothetical protein